MIKVNAEKLAEEVIPMLQNMFGDGHHPQAAGLRQCSRGVPERYAG